MLWEEKGATQSGHSSPGKGFPTVLWDETGTQKDGSRVGRITTWLGLLWCANPWPSILNLGLTPGPWRWTSGFYLIALLLFLMWPHWTNLFLLSTLIWLFFYGFIEDVWLDLTWDTGYDPQVRQNAPQHNSSIPPHLSFSFVPGLGIPLLRKHLLWSMTSLHWTWRIQHKIICNLICFSPPCFFHYSAEHLMELLTLSDVPSYSVVEVGWMRVAWVELLVAKRPMMSQQRDQDTCLVSGSAQQECTKGRRGLTSGACFSDALKAWLDWNSARASHYS